MRSGIPHHLTGPGTERLPLFVQRTRLGMGYHEHRHTFTEIDVVVSGSATHIINGTPYRVGPGDVAVFHGGTTHGYRDGRDLEVYDLMFHPHLLPVDWTPLRWLVGYQRLFVERPPGHAPFTARLHLGPAGLADLSSLVEGMLTEHRLRRPGWETALTAGLLQVVLSLARHVDSTVLEPDARDRALAQVAVALEDGSADDRSMAELGDEVGLSPWSFIRAFRARFGETPSAYRTRQRIVRACRLLRGTEQSVTEIAFACGFKDSNYFSRVFRKQMREPPQVWRRQG